MQALWNTQFCYVYEMRRLNWSLWNKIVNWTIHVWCGIYFAELFHNAPEELSGCIDEFLSEPDVSMKRIPL